MIRFEVCVKTKKGQEVLCVKAANGLEAMRIAMFTPGAVSIIGLPKLVIA